MSLLYLCLCLWTSKVLGAGRNRVRNFLFTALKECTQVRYQDSLARLNSDLATLAPDFCSQDEESRDWFLADWVLDEMEAGHDRTQLGFALSALCKSDPRANYKVAWKTFSIWG